jgi:hypothetical protein
MPDGKKYAINGPAGASKEQVIAAVQRRIGAGEEKDTTLGGELKEAVKGFIPGAAGLLETAATGAAALLPEEQEMAVRAKAAQLAGAARETFEAAPGYGESVGRKFGEALGSTAPFFALGPLGAAGRAGALGLGVGAGAGEARQRAEEEGGEEAKGTATAAGAVIGASEAIPVFNFIKRLPGNMQMSIVDRVKRAFLAGGEEGAQEAASQIGQNLIARGLYKPNQALIEGVGEEAAYGAGVGGFIQVLTDMALGRRAQPVQPPPPSAEEKLTTPPAPPTAPAGTQAAAQQDVAEQVKTATTVKQALSEEDDAAEEARLEREAREEYERQQALADLERREYSAQTLREAAEAEALAPVDEDAPYYPPTAREADVARAMSEEARAALDMNLGERLMGDESEEKRIKESAGNGAALQYPDYKSFLNAGLQAGLSEQDIAEITGVRNEQDFLDLREQEINQFVEAPAQDAVRRVYEKGGQPYSSNAFGPGRKGVEYIDAEGVQQFEPFEAAAPTTPTTEITSEPVSTRAGEADVGAAPRGAALSVQRGAPAGQEAAGSEGAGVEPVGGVAERVDEREGAVSPALTDDKTKNARAAGLDYVRSTGKVDALGLQKATGLKLPEVRALRDALIGSGAIVPVPGKKNFYQVFEDYRPAATKPVREDVQDDTDEAVIEEARARADARLRAKNAEAIKVQERADEASERAPAPQRRPTFKGVPKGTLAEDMRIAAAALDEEKAAAQLASLEQRINQAERRSSDKTLKPAERAEQRRLVKTLTDELRQRRSQRGLDLVGGSAKPSLSRAETEVLNSIKSAARFLNASGKMNDADRERYNAEIKKPKPDLAKLRKLVDKVASREDEDVGGIESNEDFYTTREQYELDEEGTYFYTERQNEYTRRGELKPLKFRRGEGKGLSASGVQATVSRIVKGWKNAPKINVVQSYTDLPGQHFPNTQGIYADGEIYLVADNLSDVAEVKATLFHESLGHFGLEQVFGKRLKEVMLNLYRTNKAVRKQADQYLARFPDTYAGETREDQIALAVEEVLAEASAAGPKVKDASALRAAFNRVANLIRKFLNAMGFPVTYTNNEINEILIQAHGAVVAGQRKERIGDGTIKYQRRQAEEHLSRVFDGNPTAPPYNSKIGDGVRGALGRVADSIVEGSLSFLSITQIAEVWASELPAAAKLDILLGRRGASEMARREEVSTNVTKWFDLSNEYRDTPEKLDMFFKVANMTTVYQVDPLNSVSRAVLNKPRNQMTSFDRVAYDIITEYDRLPANLRKAYKDLRAEYETKSNELFALMEQRLGKDVVDKLKAKYDSKRLQVYLPLWRSGNYWLTYTDRNGETITSAYASDIDRKRATEAAKADGGKDFQDFSRLREARERGAPPTGFLGDVVREMEAKGAPQDMIDAVYETFLNYLPADSIRQQFQSREKSYDMATGVDRYGMFGFEPDVFQAYANVASRMANQLTNLEYAIPLEETMKELKKQSGGEKRTNSMLGAVYDNLEKQVNFIRYPEKNWLVDGASYFSYLWFIAGNISSALVNTTQLPMVVMPLLGGKYGPTKSFAAMERAMSTYFNGSWDSNNGGKKAFPSDFTFGAAEGLDNKYKKLYNAAVSRSIIRRSTGYEITELQKAGVKDYVGTNARVVHGLGWLFQNSERFNREVTLLAAFDLAYEASGDVDKAIEEAIKVVNDAHGSALAETGPRLFQQGFGKVMFTFKRFAQAQIYLLSKLFKQAFKDADPRTREVARSQLIGVFGASFLIAGLQGMPLYGAVEFLANLLMGDDDEPYDFSAYVDSKYGVMGRKGLLNELIGLDIASRTGFNGMIWRDDHRRMAEVGPFLYALEQAMGPAYGAFLSGQRGYELFKEGEYMRSIEAITPSFIRNGFKTLRMAEEGVRNKDGTPIVEDISGYNLMMQLVGFTPSEVSAKREEASMESKLSEKLEKRRDSLLNQYAAAWMEKDREGVQEALRSIRAFNERNPMRPYFIKASTLRKSILDRREKQLMSVNGLYLSPYERYRVEQLKSGG